MYSKMLSSLSFNIVLEALDKGIRQEEKLKLYILIERSKICYLQVTPFKNLKSLHPKQKLLELISKLQDHQWHKVVYYISSKSGHTVSLIPQPFCDVDQAMPASRDGLTSSLWSWVACATYTLLSGSLTVKMNHHIRSSIFLRPPCHVDAKLLIGRPSDGQPCVQSWGHCLANTHWKSEICSWFQSPGSNLCQPSRHPT